MSLKRDLSLARNSNSRTASDSANASKLADSSSSGRLIPPSECRVSFTPVLRKLRLVARDFDPLAV